MDSMTRAAAAMLLTVAAGFTTLGVLGCASPATDGPPSEISALKMSCNKPYRLERDCSLWSSSFATREIELNGVGMHVAGSADGRVVFVVPDDLTSHAFKNDLPVATNRAAFELVTWLEAEGISIVRQIPVTTSGKAMGYVLELDRDGYSLLESEPD